MVSAFQNYCPQITEVGLDYNINAYLNKCFAFICIHLKIKWDENKCRIKNWFKKVWMGIHDMQMLSK